MLSLDKSDVFLVENDRMNYEKNNKEFDFIKYAEYISCWLCDKTIQSLSTRQWKKYHNIAYKCIHTTYVGMDI